RSTRAAAPVTARAGRRRAAAADAGPAALRPHLGRGARRARRRTRGRLLLARRPLAESGPRAVSRARSLRRRAGAADAVRDADARGVCRRGLRRDRRRRAVVRPCVRRAIGRPGRRRPHSTGQPKGAIVIDASVTFPLSAAQRRLWFLTNW